MKKKLIPVLFVIFSLGTIQLHAQQVDSAAIVKSQQRIDENLKDADKFQNRIDKKQKKIEKQQKRINRQERKKEKRMRRIDKDQNRINKATTTNTNQ